MSTERTILTIDDEAIIRSVVGAVLTQKGYRVLEAESGEKGLEILSSQPVDMLLLDLRMPDMDGLEVARQIKENPQTRQIPIIMLTGSEEEADTLASLEAGADGYLNKSVSKPELVARVRAMIRLLEIEEELVEMEKRKQEARLELARDVQRRLLPSKVPEVPGLDLCVRYRPCEAVGGDFYEFLTPSPDLLYLFMGDAEGHGISAALLMATARAYIRSNLSHEEFSPAEMLTRVNQMVCRDEGYSAFLPLICVCFNLKANELCYANAGFERPLINNRSGDSVRLEITGPIIGLTDSAAFEEEKIALNNGEALFVFTDGLSSALDPDNNEYGLNEIETVLHYHMADPAGDSADQIVASWLAHTQGEAQDDMTFFLAKCHTPP